MQQDKLLTLREVAEALGISEQEVIELSDHGKIPAYKIGGVYLRFKAEQIREIKQRIHTLITQTKERVSPTDRLADFFYFNDFYILASFIIILMLIIILKT